jgi:hypothetical protein
MSLNRRELLRNSLMTFGAAAVMRSASARIFAPGEDASVELARAGWEPVFLNAHQNETLIALSDVIIPATDTPGAKAALVNRFLDLVLSAEPVKTQTEFVTALDWMDTGATERYKANFVSLSAEQKEDFLSLLAYSHKFFAWGATDAPFVGNEHFARLKEWIAAAYYSSPIGLKELGWDSWPARGYFAGCEHAANEHTDAR